MAPETRLAECGGYSPLEHPNYHMLLTPGHIYQMSERLHLGNELCKKYWPLNALKVSTISSIPVHIIRTTRFRVRGVVRTADLRRATYGYLLRAVVDETGCHRSIVQDAERKIAGGILQSVVQGIFICRFKAVGVYEELSLVKDPTIVPEGSIPITVLVSVVRP